MPPIRSQQSLGSCASHAVIGAYEIQLLKKGYKKYLEGSELYHYYNARKDIGQLPNNVGMSIRTACSTLSRHGMGAECLWPYDITRYNIAPTQITHIFANLFKLKEYSRLYSIDDIRENVSNDIPVVCGIWLDDSFYKLNKKDYLYSPSKHNKGGHGVIITGYDSEREVLKFRNSWGSGWGRKGYFEMSYVDFIKHSFDSWRCVK